jgi:hypothetical protein
LRAGQSRELDFTPLGGAYTRMPADATAYVHHQRFLRAYDPQSVFRFEQSL